MEWFAKQLSFGTPDGLTLAPADIRYRRVGSPTQPDARYQVQFDALDLAAISRLLDRLPLDEGLRAKLAETQPRGTVRGFGVSWQRNAKGELQYAVRGSFEGMAVKPSGYLPGFSSASGSIDADQDGGSLNLRASRSVIDMPRVFLEPLPLGSLSANVVWSVSGGIPLVRLEHVAFANNHLTGSLAGTYQAAAHGPGSVDLAGSLTRLEGRDAWRYVPLEVHHEVRDWLQAAVVTGYLRDVRVRLRGELRDFPFAEGESGAFEVTAAMEGSLAYAPGWPILEDASGSLAVRGARMDVRVDRARVFNARLSNATAVIADLRGRDQILEVRGEATGLTADLLRYIAQSPIDARLGGVTRGLQVAGRGQLSLAITVPLHHMVDTTVTGRYRFADNVLLASEEVPRLERPSS